MIALRDGIEQVAAVIIAILPGHLVGFILRQMRIPVALIAVPVKLDPEFLAFLIDQHVGVAGIAVHLAPVLRNAAVAHQIGDLMRAFGAQGPEIPLHVMIAQTIVGPALLAADEMLEFQRIANEEDRRVVADHVEIAVLGIDLDRKAARIAPGVRAAALTGNRAETRCRFGLRALLENLRLGVFRHVRRGFIRAECARAFRVGLALRNALPVEVRHLLDQVMIVEDDGAVAPDRQRMFVALNRNAGVGRGEWAFGGIGHGKNPSRLRTLPEPALPMDVPRRIVVRK